jgi:uncharacterized protein (DUF488 family)
MIYTIGHSTLNEEEFINVIHPIDVVIDIRSHPTSRWEQFRKENMERWLPIHGKNYEWDPRLGGWSSHHLHMAEKFEKKMVDISAYAKGKFPKQRIGKITHKDNNSQLNLPGVKPTWTNQGLYDYGWFMSIPEFISGAEDLIQRGIKENIGIMCCEVLWWKCHRSMVADYLIWRNTDVIHLQPKPKYHADVIGTRLDRYDPEIIQAWKAHLT